MAEQKIEENKKPEVKPMDSIKGLFIWKNTSDRGDYYTLSKKQFNKTAKSTIWESIWLTPEEYNYLRNIKQ